MTDRSKSQRKRRLQLNAEEFAPPPDIYETSAEPRLDETWVQYYGGERHGGQKRLLSVEDDAAEGLPEEVAADAGGITPATVADHEQPDAAPRTERTELPEVEETETLSAVPSEQPARQVVSSLEDFRRQETVVKPAADQAPPPAKAAHEAAPRRGGRATAGRKRGDDAPALPSPSPQPEGDAPTFEEWSRRWSPWLKRGGSIKVCAAFFELTHARGSAECFTSNSAIMEITMLSRAQCIRNIHYLIEVGFLDELGEVNSREAKGTYYRFNLIPRSLVTT